MTRRHGLAARRLATRVALTTLAPLVVLGAVYAVAGPVAGRASPAAARPSTAPSPAPSAAPRSPRPVRTVVVLGDSVPAGSACACIPYGSLVATALSRQQHSDVAATNLAKPGQTTQQLLSELQQPSADAAVGAADVVIVTIGANDFDKSIVTQDSCSATAALACYQPALSALQTGLGAVLDRLQALMAKPGGDILVTGYWNVFLDGKVGAQQGSVYQANSDALTRAVNGIISATATGHTADYVDVYTPFKGDGDRDDTGLLAADGDHPNAAGHRVIAQAVESALGTRTPVLPVS